jgi:hypothetical protein
MSTRPIERGHGYLSELAGVDFSEANKPRQLVIRR